MAASRRKTSTHSSPPGSKDVFLNIPYDQKFEPLYLAYIAGVSGFGLVPRAALEIPTSQRQLDRIFKLIRRSQFSFHDISWVGLDRKPPPTPRFNMPFELGLAVSWAADRNHRHFWFVFESKPFRQQKSLSDLNGTPVHIHEGTPVGVLREITDVFAKSDVRPTVTELEAIYADLRKYSKRLKKDLATRSLFKPRPFRDLVVWAAHIVPTRVSALRALETKRDTNPPKKHGNIPL